MKYSLFYIHYFNIIYENYGEVGYGQL